MTVQLSERDCAIVLGLVRRHAPSATGVGVFGSRATGKARPGSDLDLVLYGPVSEAQGNRLATEIDDSSVAVSTDIVIYELLENPQLKAHIDAVMQPLVAADAAPAPQL
jgi:predicted nucleotidyltransferase